MIVRLSFILALIGMVLSFEVGAQAAQTQKIFISPHSLSVTAERFKDAVEAHGLVVTTMMMKAQDAESYGLDMPASIVISFGLPDQSAHAEMDGKPKEEAKAKDDQAMPVLPRAVVFANADGTVSIAVNTADASFDGQGAHGHQASGYREIIEGFAAKAIEP